MSFPSDLKADLDAKLSAGDVRGAVDTVLRAVVERDRAGLHALFATKEWVIDYCSNPAFSDFVMDDANQQWITSRLAELRQGAA